MTDELPLAGLMQAIRRYGVDSHEATLVFNRLVEEADALRARLEALEEALDTVLDAVDYTSGACRVNEMVGAVLPIELIARAKAALAAAGEVRP